MKQNMVLMGSVLLGGGYGVLVLHETLVDGRALRAVILDGLRRLLGGRLWNWRPRLQEEAGFRLRTRLIYAHLGQMDTAFEWLTRGVEQYDEFATWMNPNPAFDIMRSDPRFAAVVRKMGLESIPLPKTQ